MKVLFFINGSLPTEAQLEKASGIKGKVCFRNATMVGDDHKPEDCDFVAGEVPEAYSGFECYAGTEIKKLEPVTEPMLVSRPVAAKPKPESKTPAGWKPNA